MIGDHFNCAILLFRKWILKKSRLLCGNFISIYKINRTLHGRLGIQILSSHAESISHKWVKQTSEILSALEDKIRIPARPCNILYLLFIHHVTIFFSFLACSPLFFTWFAIKETGIWTDEMDLSLNTIIKWWCYINCSSKSVFNLWNLIIMSLTLKSFKVH